MVSGYLGALSGRIIQSPLHQGFVTTLLLFVKRLDAYVRNKEMSRFCCKSYATPLSFSSRFISAEKNIITVIWRFTDVCRSGREIEFGLVTCRIIIIECMVLGFEFHYNLSFCYLHALFMRKRERVEWNCHRFARLCHFVLCFITHCSLG